MAEAQHIDFSKLLGFDTVSDLMSDGVDFRDDIDLPPSSGPVAMLV